MRQNLTHEPIFTTETYFSSYTHDDVLNEHDLQKWNLEELQDPERMKQFRTSTKQSFTEALQKTKEAKLLLFQSQLSRRTRTIEP